MSPKSQRIAIAKACGWKWHSRIKGSIKVWDNGLDYVFYDSDLPDYLKDRNAMHEALLTLPDNDEFTAHLDQVIYEDTGRLVSKMDRVRATAKQLAKAYLVTIGKWEGGSDGTNS
jgi:hypothetical protein